MTIADDQQKTARRLQSLHRDVCRLSVHIRGVAYTARPIRPELSEVIRAWQLRKPDGTTYTIADTIDGAACDCADFTYRHDGHDQIGWQAQPRPLRPSA